MQDIFKPEPLRLRRHLSAVVNFAKFREDKAAAVEGAQVVHGLYMGVREPHLSLSLSLMTQLYQLLTLGALMNP